MFKLGDIVPADCRLSPEGGSIEADESALTGESLPVNVNPGEDAKSGAIIRKGEVEAVITATGKDTYIGEAMALVAQADSTGGKIFSPLKLSETVPLLYEKFSVSE